MVREGDEQWFDIVKWTLDALIEAEELGINSDNVASLNPSNPYLSRFLGKTGENGKILGLKNDWVVKVILSVGNYGEIYERHLGEDTDINIPRSLNNLWSEGGLMYSKPF